MRWYLLDKDYVNYLRQFDDKVQNVHYGENSLKPFIGILITINDMHYCVPVSSPKRKHMYMNDSLDFIKLMNLNKTHMFGVINLNNMIPVKKECMTPLDYKSIGCQTDFSSETQKEGYIRLLKNELRSINEKADKIIANASRLRENCMNYPKGKYALRSCNFALLELKCAAYKGSPHISQAYN